MGKIRLMIKCIVLAILDPFSLSSFFQVHGHRKSDQFFNLRQKWNIRAKMGWTRFCLLGPPFSNKQSVSQSVFQWSFSSVGPQVSRAEYEAVETLPELPEDSPSSEDKVPISGGNVFIAVSTEPQLLHPKRVERILG